MSTPPPGADYKQARIRFDDFELDARAGELRRGDRRIRLQGKPFQVLLALLERPGEVVLREELRGRLWPGDTFVDFDNNLNTAVNKVREALGESAGEPRYLETLPKRGYRFLKPVEVEDLTPTSNGRPWVRRTTIAAALLLGLLGILAYWRPAADTRPPVSQAHVLVAVLPFESLDEDSGRDYFGDGLTEEMIVALAGALPQGFGVIAHHSARQFRQSGSSPGDIGKQLGAAYLLRGSVRSQDDQVRVTAQLIQTRDQASLWAETYDRRLQDVFEIQSDLARRISQSLSIRLHGNREPRQPTASPAAYEAYLKARYMLNSEGPGKLDQAVNYLQEALRLDPRFALAHAGLADAYSRMPGPPADSAPKAKAAAEEALRLDDSLGAAHLQLAQIHLYYERDWDAARRSFERAAELSPGSVDVLLAYAGYFSLMGRHDDALAAMHTAMQLDPVRVAVAADAGWYYYVARRYEDAVAQCLKALELEPDHRGALSYLLVSYLELGRRTEAVDTARRILTLEGAPADTLAMLRNETPQESLVYFWRWSLGRLEDRARTQYVAPSSFALLHVALGNTDAALDRLEESFAERSGWLLPFMKVYPRLDPIRSHPRFQELQRRLGL